MSTQPDDIRILDIHDPVMTAEQRVLRDQAAKNPPVMTVDAVLAAARKKSGLDDFGPEDFIERLELWLRVVDDSPNMLALGKQTVFNMCVGLSTARLRVEDTLRRHPEILDTDIEAPIIIAGLPRSGTTHLVNLISADQRLRSMQLWESMEPIPDPNEAITDDENDPRFIRCQQAWEQKNRLLPYQVAMHPMSPEHVHEDSELQAIDFSSYNLDFFANAPGWRDYYFDHDQTPHYEYAKKVLKIMQWRRGPNRWILKSPQHLEQLGSLIKTYPDATVVVNHRDPLAVLQSMLTMNCYCQRLRMQPVDTKMICEYWVDRIERTLRACVRDYELLPVDKRVDVIFHEFMTDDIAMVEKIYQVAELPMDTRAAEQLSDYGASHPRGKNGKIIYDLAGDFGIDIDALRERYQFYFDRFPIRAEI